MSPAASSTSFPTSTGARGDRRARLRGSVSSVLLILAMLVGPAGPVRAETPVAEVEARQEKGYGRMVLTFRNRQLMPQYTTKQANNVLVIEFTEPVDVAIEPVEIGRAHV